MTVLDLIQALEELPKDMEVQIVTQPTYPLRNEVYGLCKLSHVDEDVEEDSDKDVLFLLEGAHPRESPYGSKECWMAAYK